MIVGIKKIKIQTMEMMRLCHPVKSDLDIRISNKIMTMRPTRRMMKRKKRKMMRNRMMRKRMMKMLMTMAMN